MCRSSRLRGRGSATTRRVGTTDRRSSSSTARRRPAVPISGRPARPGGGPPLAHARCPRPRRTEWAIGATVRHRDARPRRRGLRRRPRSRDLPPARLLDGCDHRAVRRDESARAASVARRHRQLAAASAPCERRTPLLRSNRIEHEPAYVARLARDHDPGLGDGGWRRLVTAIAADVWTQRLLMPRDLRRVEMPSLVVAGDRDPFTPVGHAQELARQLPDAGLLIVPTQVTTSPGRHPRYWRPSQEVLPVRRTVRRPGEASPTDRQRTWSGEGGPADEVTLVAMFRRPDGGADALAAFERAYARPTCRSSPRRRACAGCASCGSVRRSARRPTWCWCARWTSTTARPSTPDSRRTRCARAAATFGDRPWPRDARRRRVR